MQTSQSFAGFAGFAPFEHQRQASTQTRAQRRSSLDTFLIPGRTRLPSSRASTFDIPVTQGLLDSSLPHPSRNMPSAESFEWSPPAGCMPHRGPAPISGQAGPQYYRVRPEIVKRPPPRFGGREVIILPSQRPRPHAPEPEPPSLGPISSPEPPSLGPISSQEPPSLGSIPSQEHANVPTYDGADDSGMDSRHTSMTWSTVSHRVFSDSSGSSRTMGVSYYRDEYNRMAEKNGLPRLEPAPAPTPDDDEKHTQTKTTTKVHRQGWLARKLFRRSASTYTLKAKTTYKPISKKKSFAGMPVLSADIHKNTLKGKTLEELSRLGGLSIFILPPDFAVDKLTLPTCLAATATYLYQHGCNAPGIFRVSGQTTIVNALYDFYDHQFSNADPGSPSKVEQTVGSGLLPSHIEHTVPDVASFFKRVLIDLPGGLLGSVKLFEALRNVTTNFGHDPELSEPDLASLKAKMIALAISSVASDYRLYLIQAVLGLVSYLGQGVEKLQAQTASAGEDQAPSELMSYRSLGVVLGPLLLGNLTDSAIHGSGEVQNGAPHISLETDSAKKFRKHKRKHSDMKLDQSATLAAFVDRANRTAVVMQQLLLMWPDVVKQLREINSTASSSLNSGSKPRLKKVPSRTGSRLTMKTSEEDMRFLDILRGRALPQQFRGNVRMKSNMRIKSRSPMPWRLMGPSEDENPDDSWLPAGEDGSPPPGHTGVAQCAARDNEIAVDINLRSVESSLADDIGLSAENRTHSDVAMEKMAMGTILPPLQIKPSPSPRQEYLRLADPAVETPRKARTSSSSSKTPETALRDAPPAETSHESDEFPLRVSTGKPLPRLRDAQTAEISVSSSKDETLDVPPKPFTKHLHRDTPRPNTSSRTASRNSFSNRQARQSAERTIFPSSQSAQWPLSPTKHSDEEAVFPTRQSSLPVDKHLALKPIEAYSSLAEYKAQASTHMSPPEINFSRRASEARLEESEIDRVEPKPNNVKVLAQKFAEASRARRSSDKQTREAKDTAIPRIHAYVSSLPSPKSPMLGLDDPFLSAESNNVSKESLIPKPVIEVGRSRESRSLSPPKRTTPKEHAPKRHSAFGIMTDRDAEIVQKNTISSPPATPTTGEGETYEELIVNSNGIGFSKQPLTQLLDAYHHQRSAESLRRLRTLVQESPSESSRVHSRTISFAEPPRPISSSRPDSPSPSIYANLKDSPNRTNSYLNASDALKPLERHNSINTTMYGEICRLQRLLQQMGEEKEAKDRRIEALEEIHGSNPVAAGVKAKGSFDTGGSYDQFQKANRELVQWKTRAELAERRLSGLKQSSDNLWKSETMDLGYKEQGEKLDIVQKQEIEKKQGDFRDVQGDRAITWKRRAIVAESQLTQMKMRENTDKERDVQELQGDSPDFWKRRAIIAESQLAQITPLMENGPHKDMVRTTPLPLTANVYVQVETEGSLSSGENGQGSSEKEVGRRTRSMEKRRQSDERSFDFVSPLNGSS